MAGVPMSPYCWRIRASLILLAVPFETRLLGLTEIGRHFSGTHKTVPVLLDGERDIGESRAIAEYLAGQHDPDRQLFGGTGGRSLATFVTAWVDATLLPAVNRMIVKDLHDGLRPEDRAYFRRGWEKSYGRTLEEVQAQRESERPAFQVSLHPARRAVKEQPFLAGDSPNYGDFALHSTFQWIRAATNFELLRPDDRLHQWIDRMDEWLQSR